MSFFITTALWFDSFLAFYFIFLVFFFNICSRKWANTNQTLFSSFNSNSNKKQRYCCLTISCQFKADKTSNSNKTEIWMSGEGRGSFRIHGFFFQWKIVTHWEKTLAEIVIIIFRFQMSIHFCFIYLFLICSCDCKKTKKLDI